MNSLTDDQLIRLWFYYVDIEPNDTAWGPTYDVLNLIIPHMGRRTFTPWQQEVIHNRIEKDMHALLGGVST